MGKDSRQRILELLKRFGPASVTELSRRLDLTSVTIRHHLDGLIGDGLIAPPETRAKPGPGRPEMVYRLTPEADTHMPRNYAELCGCLLAAVSSTPGGDIELTLRHSGSTLGLAADARGNRKRVTAELEQRGYYPTLKRTPEGVLLELHNCPYLEVAQRAPVLCQFDRALVEGLFGRAVEMQGRIVTKHDLCTFLIPRN